MSSGTPHDALPSELVGLIGGQPGLDSTEQAFPFLTTDPEGFPHVALLSRSEIELTSDRRRLVADSLGISLSPILFRTSAELSETEQWARSAPLLSLLATREH